MSIPEMKARWLDDLTVGEQRRTGTYEVTREEIIEFAGEFDPQPFHLDDAAADASIFGGLCASGWHTASITMRLLIEGQQLNPAAMGSPGFDELNWFRPVRPGDTLYCTMTCLSVVPSKSKPDRGVARFHVETFNQADERVMDFKSIAMFRRKQ